MLDSESVMLPARSISLLVVLLNNPLSLNSVALVVKFCSVLLTELPFPLIAYSQYK